jgi:polyhydroxyalkanoate synthesis repressor PhaR
LLHRSIEKTVLLYGKHVNINGAFIASRQWRGLVNTETVIIRKYGNRRLYDTSTSQYITLEEIAALIRSGKDVRVVDAKTGQDLTRVTLTQIIVEDAKGAPTGLPLELLRQLIVASDRAGREFVMWYLNSALNAYQKVQDSLQSGLDKVRSAVLPPLEMMKVPSEGGRVENNSLRKRVARSKPAVKKSVSQQKRRKPKP